MQTPVPFASSKLEDLKSSRIVSCSQRYLRFKQVHSDSGIFLQQFGIIFKLHILFLLGILLIYLAQNLMSPSFLICLISVVIAFLLRSVSVPFMFMRDSTCLSCISLIFFCLFFFLPIACAISEQPLMVKSEVFLLGPHLSDYSTDLIFNLT